MKILYINSAQYDFLTATLIEGLTELGHDIVCSLGSSYGKAIEAKEIPAVAEAADLIIIGSNHGVNHHLLEDVKNPRIVAVDGSDHASFEVPGTTRVKAVFKRELCLVAPNPAENFIYPMPFAAEKRYFTPPVEKDILVSFVANTNTIPVRHSIHVRLRNRNHPAIFSGSTNERSYSVTSPRPIAVETPTYRQLLARSQISISAPGAGYDCARYWEILAARAMLFTYTPDILIPNGFTDGVNCATFSSLQEFDDKLDYYLARPERVAEIATAGFEHLLAYHTTSHRAAYFLNLAIPAAKREGFCDRFYTGESEQNPLLTRLLGRRNVWRARSLVGTTLRTCLRPFRKYMWD